ncbi:NAD(P)-dependent oxidoreductase [Microbacterium gorillae]|uniref:NAD(P)-dependent oxidoreductase n=1 Tax=Microbacterium gorillae TaxID=1231063 RepID=UPI00058DD310|nr:NAD(P)-dependent oxidoreductase [Microbacterium gorillae]
MIIGFIGVGTMGGPICSNLLRQTDHDIRVFDLNDEAVARVEALGATRSGLAELCAAADVILTSLPAVSIVEKIALGEDGVLGNAKPGTTYIDLSTTSVSSTRAIAAKLAAAGIDMLDAPISTSADQAGRGEMAMMVGGDPEVFERHRELFHTMGDPDKVFYVGGIGNGLVVKIVNNYLAQAYTAAASEAFAVGVSAGIDAQVLHNAISQSSGNSMMYQVLANRALAGRYDDPDFTLDLGYKDAQLFLELSDDLKIPTPIGSDVHTQMRFALGGDRGKLDHTVVMRVYEDLLGIDISQHEG